jgi:hypothetical protein
MFSSIRRVAVEPQQFTRAGTTLLLKSKPAQVGEWQRPYFPKKRAAGYKGTFQKGGMLY